MGSTLHGTLQLGMQRHVLWSHAVHVCVPLGMLQGLQLVVCIKLHTSCTTDRGGTHKWYSGNCSAVQEIRQCGVNQLEVLTKLTAEVCVYVSTESEKGSALQALSPCPVLTCIVHGCRSSGSTLSKWSMRAVAGCRPSSSCSCRSCKERMQACGQGWRRRWRLQRLGLSSSSISNIKTSSSSRLCSNWSRTLKVIMPAALPACTADLLTAKPAGDQHPPGGGSSGGLQIPVPPHI